MSFELEHEIEWETWDPVAIGGDDDDVRSAFCKAALATGFLAALCVGAFVTLGSPVFLAAAIALSIGTNMIARVAMIMSSPVSPVFDSNWDVLA